MDFSEYQKKATARAFYPDRGSNLPYVILGLCGEAGEVAEKVKKLIRDEGGDMTLEAQAAITKELGDVLWYIAAACDELRIDLQAVADANLEKVEGRYERGTRGGSGDDR